MRTHIKGSSYPEGLCYPSGEINSFINSPVTTCPEYLSFGGLGTGDGKIKIKSRWDHSPVTKNKLHIL
jgi:hypothetical protein